MGAVTSIKLNIAEKLADKSYRAFFFKEWAQDNVAMTIRAMRDKREFRQKQLADLAGMKQSAISRIEQADYSAWSFTTLLRVAEALDARIRVTFEPAEDVIDQYNLMENQKMLKPDTVKVYGIPRGSRPMDYAIGYDYTQPKTVALGFKSTPMKHDVRGSITEVRSHV